MDILAKRHPSLLKGDYPAGVIWQQAKDYCQWLGKESDKNIVLPTEAQWEYAARSRGQYLPFSTNNGNFELGSNIPEQKKLDVNKGQIRSREIGRNLRVYQRHFTR